jgi:hypothetical protein
MSAARVGRLAGQPKEISAAVMGPAMEIKSAAPVKVIAVLARMGIGDHVQMAIAARARTETVGPGWMATVDLARTEIAARSRVVSEAVSRSKTAARKLRVVRRRISNQLAAIPSVAKPPRLWRWLCVLLCLHVPP